jgi:hypothetical protein
LDSKVKIQSVTFGISLSTLLFLGKWITANTLLIGAESIITLGVLAAIAFALMGTIALILFGFVANKVRDSSINITSIESYLSNKMTPLGYKLIRFVTLILTLLSIYISLVAGATVIYGTFDLPVRYSIVIFGLSSLIYAFLFNLEEKTNFNVIKVPLLSTFIIILLVYFYVTKGIEHIFDGIRLYHPYLLVVDKSDTFIFIIASSFILFGRVILDPITWRSAFLVEKKKIRLYFIFTGLVWGAIPIAFSTLVLSVIYKGGFKNINTVLYDLFHSIGSPILFTLFFLAFISTILSSVAVEYRAVFLIGSYNLIPKLKLKQMRLLLGIIFIILIYLITAKFEPTLFQLFIILGIPYASLVFPLINIIYSRKIVGYFPTVSIVICIAIGYFSTYIIDIYFGIFISIILSLLLTIIYYIWDK